MNTETQMKLLEFLESGTVENPVTGEKKRSDVRVIAASRKDLAKEAKEGRFREDLFYKLNVAPITLPALRERKEDLPAIVDFFLGRLSQKLNRAVERVDPSCMDVFRTVSWPGNLRQLEHVLERMVLLADGNTLRASDIPPDLRSEIDLSSGSEAGNFREIVRRQTQSLEKDLIEKALEEMDGNITRTAEQSRDLAKRPSAQDERAGHQIVGSLMGAKRTGLEAKLAQMFFLGTPAAAASKSTIEFLTEYQPGGVIYFAHNYEKPALLAELSETIQDTREKQAWNLPLFIGADHEGGRVQALRENPSRVSRNQPCSGRSIRPSWPSW